MTESSHASSLSLVNLVRNAAGRWPSKIAVCDGSQSHTFGEMERVSTNYARHLLSLGVQKGDRIVFCSVKSANIVIGILGCIKAGAVYVPVDCKQPRDRLLFILNDVSPRFVVANRALYDTIAVNLACTCTLIDEIDILQCGQRADEDFLLPVIVPEDIAYCIYTSGSTGRPKGVLIQHGSVDAFFRALAEVMPIDESCRCMNTSELCFDVHIMDLFFPLYRGASVRLSSGPMIANRLLQVIEEHRITHFTAVGPVMTLMTEGSAFSKRNLSSLVRVMTGAEIINVETVQKWLRRVPGLTVVNGYGPTEATVICTAFFIDQIEPCRSEFYPIGKPMKETEVLVVNGDQIIWEPGVKGELLIGGPQVMKGYWNNHEQTNDRMTVVAGKRYYRSGDVCQWRADGNLDYVDRNDEEIKLSGFRINLNEIKRVMDSIPSVLESHPLVAVHPALGKVIAACFTRTDPGPPDDELFGNMQAVLKRELPYYMVPSLYFIFDGFPSLSSGKTDNKQILNRVNQCMANSDPRLTRYLCREDTPPTQGKQMETPESWFHRRATFYVEAQILFHLNQAGVWGLLKSRGPLTARQIAEALRLDDAATDTLLDYVFEVDDLLDRDTSQCYSLSEFGRKVIERYSDMKGDLGQPSINMFDVRVGAYGPVWQNLGALLRGARYGDSFRRDGRFAENGVFKLAMRFWNSLIEQINHRGVDSMIEVGLTTGLLERLAESHSNHALYGIDKSKETIERTAANVLAKKLKNVRLIEGDFFDVDRWCKFVDKNSRGLIYSLHFHELVAGGENKFVDALRVLKAALPNWTVVAFEQPRAPHTEKNTLPEPLWLYAQSNILIHHLVGNGRILGSDAWMKLGHQAGCRHVSERTCNYLGYRAFVYQL